MSSSRGGHEPFPGDNKPPTPYQPGLVGRAIYFFKSTKRPKKLLFFIVLFLIVFTVPGVSESVNHAAKEFSKFWATMTSNLILNGAAFATPLIEPLKTIGTFVWLIAGGIFAPFTLLGYFKRQ